jgi:hypothetical protein
LLNLDTLYVEELIGQLKADEEYHEHEGPEAKHAGKLVLSEEEWLARMNLGVEVHRPAKQDAEASSREAVDMAT